MVDERLKSTSARTTTAALTSLNTLANSAKSFAPCGSD
jgi:hypothetical protein